MLLQQLEKNDYLILRRRLFLGGANARLWLINEEKGFRAHSSGSSSAVERQLPKLDVAGSIPVSRSIFSIREQVTGAQLKYVDDQQTGYSAAAIQRVQLGTGPDRDSGQ